MRLRALLIVATMVLGVVLLSGVALAKNITGTFGQDNLRRHQPVGPDLRARCRRHD